MRAGKLEYRGFGEDRGLFDDPTFSANRNAIACCKRHGCAMAMRIPWKNYSALSAFGRFNGFRMAIVAPKWAAVSS